MNVSLSLSLSRSLVSFLFLSRTVAASAPRRILRDTQQVIERRVRAHMQMTFVYMRNQHARTQLHTHRSGRPPSRIQSAAHTGPAAAKLASAFAIRSYRERRSTDVPRAPWLRQ